MGLVQREIRIDCDSQSVIFLAKNPAYHSNIKHIDVQYHFVRDMVEDKRVLLGGNFEEFCRRIDEVCEHSKVLLV